LLSIDPELFSIPNLIFWRLTVFYNIEVEKL
jgi:hypothetical protein